MSRHAPHTFGTKGDAGAWLTATQASIQRASLLGEAWQAPEDVQAAQQRAAAASMTFGGTSAPGSLTGP